MDLYIDSPAYFSRIYGVDDEVYRYCRTVRAYFADKEYSDTLHSIGILPVAAPQENDDKGHYPEEIRFMGRGAWVP